ncbi:rhodanese-like domain-containing protein [Fulvivirga sp. RKSG066]|uniref:rhodanese-like domain-containing protein n=1 Tax=Fulvivirga aurantia TaxID=2529383 RepID=UPI0012BD5261|nr:rhodanese-like domain-containing protein [Fulvivirga aurantia]MTI21497.1 rhodanese-like domain-containing protein [Fulvivirga aurantia]
MRFILSAILIFVMYSGFAQKVSSTAYDLVLKTLLSSNVATISISDAAKGNFHFIDARSLEEYQVSHIAEATWVGFDSFDIERTSCLSKDEPLVIYCSIGYRSEKITEKLQAAGFTRVYNLYGGLFEWVNQGKSVYKDGCETKNVHAFNKTWGIWLKKGKKVY